MTTYMKLLPVIMAGGSGIAAVAAVARAVSQFLALDGKQSMMQATVQRLAGLAMAQPLLICNEAHPLPGRRAAASAWRAMRQHPCSSLSGAIFMPAVALAALHATAGGEDPLLLVLAADHLIQDTAAFQDRRAPAPLAVSDHW